MERKDKIERVKALVKTLSSKIPKGYAASVSITDEDIEALSLLISIAERIDKEKIRRILAEKIPLVLDGREDLRETLAQAITQYLEGGKR